MKTSIVSFREFVCATLIRGVQFIGTLGLLSLLCVPLFSQANQGAIQGGVFDQSGGAVAGASITIIDVARGVTRTLAADNAGQYVAPNLTPGTYTIRAQANGFRVVEHSGVLVEVGQSVRVDLTLQPGEQTQTFLGTGENNDQSIVGSVIEPWNYSGAPSAFKPGPTPIPCFGKLSGCTAYSGNIPPAACVTAAQAPYAGNTQLQQLAVAALYNSACYEQNGGILTPPAYGTIGNAGRGIFPGPDYYNVDFSLAKDWKWKERFGAQFRFEVFNLLNRADLAVPTITSNADPSKGVSGQFGCACSTPDSTNPVLGSGGPRHIQFGLKLTY